MTSSSATYPSIKTKSFRERRQLPPYRKPLVRRTNERKVSWLTRVKNFFIRELKALYLVTVVVLQTSKQKMATLILSIITHVFQKLNIVYPEPSLILMKVPSSLLLMIV